ncbi:transglycosylase SLT domain-containing protein [Aestuariirhabdus litorea]|uniref:Lytic murein transglycosylase n=1 Tax=Aestuariirhabdus litorea TaxID=2528527 RepID=A0A3P3VRN5_9GAMM|nr:transglycosylase SLT domain-containing protein [Aestuariirhabdus litorea]RRJ84648.1 lytic murein transglycosylase [Aestuariirhabdus litorea]RWW97873.1 lytic murein transglycosylase [Endozoicomonadaceae bacterium GTF-13]
MVKIHLLLLFAITLLSGTALANINIDVGQYDQERKLYAQALNALAKGEIGHYHRLRKQLTQYPLYPYLLHRDLMRRLYTLPNEEIAAFIRRYPELPITRKLHQRWLEKLAEGRHWATFEANYEATVSNASIKCFLYRAALSRGDTARAWAGAKALWVTGQSRPDSCDPLFMAWHQSGEMTTELVWDRITLAYEQRNARLGRYLIRYLPEDEQALGQLFRSVYRRPEQLSDTRRFSPSGERFGDIIYIGLHRLAYREPLQALELWNQYQQQRRFDPDRQRTLDGRISLYLLKQFNGQQLPWVEQVTHSGEHPSLVEWRIRLALREQDWGGVLDWIGLLPIEAAQHPRWQYWKIRAQEMLEPLPAPGYFMQEYQQQAKKRGYYGFLAATRIGDNYSITDLPATTETPLLSAVSALPAIQRAYELYLLRDLPAARREWRYLSEQLSQTELIAAARIANDWQWFNQAIRSAISAQQWDDLELRFPLAFKENILRQSERNNLDSSWVFAVARQESAFMEDARSSAGALGLLQLMPSTARQVARQAKFTYHGKRDLLNPETNIQLGSRYLAQLLEQFGGNRVLATAAYNAGPSRVRQWLANTGTLPFDIWIETIPFEETRQYVQNVLSFSLIYRDKLGANPQLLTMEEISHDYSLN